MNKQIAKGGSLLLLLISVLFGRTGVLEWVNCLT